MAPRFPRAGTPSRNAATWSGATASAPRSWILGAVQLKSATGCGKRRRFPAHDRSPRRHGRQRCSPRRRPEPCPDRRRSHRMRHGARRSRALSGTAGSPREDGGTRVRLKLSPLPNLPVPSRGREGAEPAQPRRPGTLRRGAGIHPTRQFTCVARRAGLRSGRAIPRVGLIRLFGATLGLSVRLLAKATLIALPM